LYNIGKKEIKEQQMSVNVFDVKTKYTEHAFNNKYIELIIEEANHQNENTGIVHNEIMIYDQYMKQLWRTLSKVTETDVDIEQVEDINVNFNSSETKYIFNNIAQMGLAMELFSFMWDMKSQNFSPLPHDTNLSETFN
jgi:hypothetical protein